MKKRSQKNTASQAVAAGAILLSAALFSGCASLPDQHSVPQGYAKDGQYDNAVKYLETNKASIYGDKDAVVFDLDDGILRHYSGDYETSTSHLKDGEQLIEDLYTKSVTQAVGSFIVNDKMLDYPGEDYEDIYTNLFMSLNYLHQDNLEDAIVETNRFFTKQQKIASRHQAEIEKARDSAKDSNDKTVAIEFHNSALAQYLAMLEHRADGDMDAASSDQRMIADAFNTQKNLYDFSVPSSVKDELSVSSKAGRLNVIAFSGMAPIKYEQKTHAGDFVIAIPIMAKQPSSVGRMEVSATNETTGVTTVEKLEEIESIENIALDTFRRRSEVIYKKAVARMIVKGVTTVASREAGKEMSKNKDSTVAAVGSMLQLFSVINRIADEAAEQADLRTSRYLPSRADAGGITLDPGTYDVTVSFYGTDGVTLVAKRSFQAVRVEPRKLALVEAVCLGDKIAPVIPPATAVPVTDTAIADATPASTASASAVAPADSVAPAPAPTAAVPGRSPFVLGLTGSLLLGAGSEWDSDYYSASYGSSENEQRIGGGFSFYMKAQGKNFGFMSGMDFLFNNGLTSNDSYTVLVDDYTDTAKISVTTLDVPLLLSYDVPVGKVGLTFFGGAHMSVPLSIEESYDNGYNDSSATVKYSPSGLNFGLTAGFGLAPYTGSGFVLNARYVMDLTETYGTYNSDRVALYTRKIWLLSAGFQF